MSLARFGIVKGRVCHKIFDPRDRLDTAYGKEFASKFLAKLKILSSDFKMNFGFKFILAFLAIASHILIET